MTMSSDLSKFEDLFDRARKYTDKNLNEAQTIKTFVEPFLRTLGYDDSDPEQVTPQYPIEVGDKKVEWVDFALLHNGEPDILIECKALADKLDKSKSLQLRRYFNLVSSCKIGVLTNGVRYLFYTDKKMTNTMDDEAFLEADFSGDDKQFLVNLKSLSAGQWDLEEFKSSSEDLRRLREAMEIIAQGAAKPDDDLTKYFMGKISPDIRFTAKTINEFRPIVKEAFTKYIHSQVIKTAEGVLEGQAKSTEEATREEEGDGIYTTDTEIEGYFAVKTLLHTTIDTHRIVMRDQKSFCSILLDGSNRKTICRFFNFADREEGIPGIGKGAHVIISSTEKGERFVLNETDDLYPLKDKLIEAVKRLETV
jgi:hypothetical protein